MKIIRLFTGIVIVSILLINYCAIQIDARGIGVSSSPIIVNDAIKGESYYRTLTVYNIDNNETVVLLSSIGDIQEWITFSDYNNDSITFDQITIPAKDNKKVLVNITIPEKIANDKYNGTIIVKEKRSGENISYTNASILTFAYPLNVAIDVTGEQYINFTIDAVYIEDTEVGYPTITNIRVINNGNVIARPKIYETITKNNIPAVELTDTNVKIQPGSSKSYELTWNTSGFVPGEYVANITIFLQGQIILSKDIPFTLLKVGELKRDGYLSNITVYGDLANGKKITIYGKFNNTGQIELPAKYITKIMNDNELIDTIETGEKQIPKGKSYTFILEYSFLKNGTYSLENYVVYHEAIGYKQTNSSFIELKVGADTLTPTSISPVLFILISIIAFVCFLVFIIRKRTFKTSPKKSVDTKNSKKKNSSINGNGTKNTIKKIKQKKNQRKLKIRTKIPVSDATKNNGKVFAYSPAPQKKLSSSTKKESLRK